MLRRHLILLLVGLALIAVGVALLAGLRLTGPADQPGPGRALLATASLASLLVGCLLLIAAAALNWLSALHRQRVLRAAERHWRSRTKEAADSGGDGRG